MLLNKNKMKNITLLKPPKIIIPKRTKQKLRKNNKKIAKIRRQRGYHWEDTIVKRFNALNGWKAFRLGSPSIRLPDVFAVSNTESTIFTIEAKSGTGTTLFVPFDQIIRCQKWIETFSLYKNKRVILAFKFLSKKRIGLGEYESRELREFFKIWDESMKITDCVCDYDGKTFALKNRKRIKIDLDDQHMPFH